MNSTFILQKDVIDDLFIREEEYKNFIKFLKKNYRNYTLITDFENEADFKKHAQENPLLDVLLDKFNKIKYIVDLKEKLENKEVLKISSIRSIVLSNLDDKLCNDYLENHGILFFNLTNLGNWNKYNDILFSKSIKVTADVKVPEDLRFKNFNDISKYFHYCNTIIIFDKFIFENKSNQKLKDNLYPFIESILSMNKSMDIMIVSEFKDEEITTQFETLSDYLIEKGYANFNLNLVHHHKAFYPRKFEGLHSRFILSNYLHIRSNDSFNFFKENGEFNNLVDIDIKFNLTTQNSYSFNKDLDSVKIYISKIKNESNCSNKNLKITFFKDKMNQLFN